MESCLAGPKSDAWVAREFEAWAQGWDFNDIGRFRREFGEESILDGAEPVARPISPWTPQVVSAPNPLCKHQFSICSEP